MRGPSCYQTFDSIDYDVECGSASLEIFRRLLRAALQTSFRMHADPSDPVATGVHVLCTHCTQAYSFVVVSPPIQRVYMCYARIIPKPIPLWLFRHPFRGDLCYYLNLHLRVVCCAVLHGVPLVVWATHTREITRKVGQPPVTACRGR